MCLDTLGEEGMMYQPGDHLYIYPENSEDHVNKLLQRVKCTFNKDDIVTVEQNTGGTLFWFAVVLFIFFFKQKTAYEIGVRLVGSEMCIRDSQDNVDIVYLLSFL